MFTHASYWTVLDPEHRGMMVANGAVKSLLKLTQSKGNTPAGITRAAHSIAKIGVTMNPELAFPGQRVRYTATVHLYNVHVVLAKHLMTRMFLIHYSNSTQIELRFDFVLAGVPGVQASHLAAAHRALGARELRGTAGAHEPRERQRRRDARAPAARARRLRTHRALPLRGVARDAAPSGRRVCLQSGTRR